MKNRIWALHNYLSNLNRIKLVLLFVVINIFLSISCTLIDKVIFHEDMLKNAEHNNWSFIETMLISLVFAPIFETIIFQYGIIQIARKFLPIIVCAVLSAIAFGYSHGYNIFYSVFTFMSGLCFAYLYLLERKPFRGFLLVTSQHFVYNLIAFLLQDVFK